MTLRFPSAIFGPRPQVVKNLQPFARKLAKGVPWSEVWGPADLAVTDTPGLVVLSGPFPLLASDPHFQAYVPLWLLHMKLGVADDALARVAQQALAVPWGLLSVLSPANMIATIPRAIHLPVVRAVLEHWDSLTSVDRYSTGQVEGRSFAATTTNLFRILRELGVPLDELPGLQRNPALLRRLRALAG